MSNMTVQVDEPDWKKKFRELPPCKMIQELIEFFWDIGVNLNLANQIESYGYENRVGVTWFHAKQDLSEQELRTIKATFGPLKKLGLAPSIQFQGTKFPVLPCGMEVSVWLCSMLSCKQVGTKIEVINEEEIPRREARSFEREVPVYECD